MFMSINQLLSARIFRQLFYLWIKQGQKLKAFFSQAALVIDRPASHLRNKIECIGEGSKRSQVFPHCAFLATRGASLLFEATNPLQQQTNR